MNSAILNSLKMFFMAVKNCFLESVIGKCFLKVASAISKSWKNSSIISLFRKDERNYNNGILLKILYLPFTLCELVNKKASDKLYDGIQRSFICKISRIYINNFLAINTRFFGILILSFTLMMSVFNIIKGAGISILIFIISIIGAVLIISNFNIMKFLNNSIAVNFIKSCAGFKDLDIEVYKNDLCKGAERLAISALTGIVSAIAVQALGIIGILIPFAIFGLLVVLYAPISGVFFAVFLAPFVPTMILAGLTLWTFMALVLKSIYKKGFKWKFDTVGTGIIMFLIVLFVSSLSSFSTLQSLKVWAMYLVFISFYFVILNAVDTKEQLHSILKLFIISGALVALYGVMQYLFGWTTANAWIDEEMFEDATMRVYSTLGNPNVLGEYLLLVLPISAVWFLKFKSKEISKWVYAVIFLVLALCLVLTQSRGCWIGFMLSVVVFVTFYEGRWWGLIPVVLCILPFVVPETMIDRFLSIGNMDDSSTSYRVFIWLGTLGMLKHYWLGGIGMGEAAFNEVYPFFSYNAIQAPHSHNLFLQLTVEAGIVALVIFVGVQLIFAKKMSDVYRLQNKKSTDSALALAISSGVIGFLAQSMFDYTFYNYRVMAIFFMVMAFGMSLYHIKKEEKAV